MKKIWKIIKLGLTLLWKIKWVKRLVLVITGILLFWIFFLKYVDQYEVGIARNIISGKTWLLEGNGLNFKAPWVYIPKIDTRPMRVEICSAGHGFSAKLVQFNKKCWEDFANTEGVWFYWWANRISFNSGYDVEHRGIKDILRGYAYSPKKYSFIIILEEYGENY